MAAAIIVPTAVVVRRGGGVKGAPLLVLLLRRLIQLWRRLAFNVACSLCVSSNEHSSYILLSRIPNHQLCSSTTCATVCSVFVVVKSV